MTSGGTAGGLAETRERILAATWKLLGESSDLGVRIADIAAVAGVSRQAIYLHFGDRANLLLAAVQYRDIQSPTAAAIRQALAIEPSPAALEGFVHAWFRHVPRIQPVAHLLSAASQTNAEANIAWEDRMTLMRGHSLALAKRLAADGFLKPEWTVEQAADWIWHRTHLDGWRHLVIQRGWDADRYAQRVSASLRNDLLATP